MPDEPEGVAPPAESSVQASFVSLHSEPHFQPWIRYVKMRNKLSWSNRQARETPGRSRQGSVGCLADYASAECHFSSGVNRLTLYLVTNDHIWSRLGPST